MLGARLNSTARKAATSSAIQCQREASSDEIAKEESSRIGTRSNTNFSFSQLTQNYDTKTSSRVHAGDNRNERGSISLLRDPQKVQLRWRKVLV